MNTLNKIISMIITITLLSQNTLASTQNTDFDSFDDDTGFKIETLNEKKSKLQKKELMLQKNAFTKNNKTTQTVNKQNIHISLPDGMKENIDSSLALLNKIESIIPYRYTSVKKLEKSFNGNLNLAIEYLKKDIGYLPYIGVLRGADGVVATGKGNAWDQALLLATLINNMGMEAEIAQGILNDDDTQRLMEQAFTSTQRADLMPDIEALKKLVSQYDIRMFNKLQESFSPPIKKNTNPLLENTHEISTTLLNLFKKSSMSFDKNKNITPLTNEISQDYVWVRWRENSEKPWKELHPAFGMSNPPHVTMKNIITNHVPKTHLHQVSLRLYIERNNAQGKSELVPMMDAYKQPASEFYKNQIPFGMLQDKKNSNFLLPMINGKLASGAKVVTSTGLTGDPATILDPEGHGAGDFIATTSNKLAQSMSLLSTLGVEKKKKNIPMRLTGILVEYKISIPNKPEKTILRRIFDFRESKMIDDLSKATFRAVVDVDIGKQDISVVSHQSLEKSKKIIKSLPWIYALSKGEIKIEQLANISNFPGLPSVSWIDFNLFANTFLNPNTEKQISLRPEVFLATRYILPGKGIKGTSISDFISNTSMVIRKDANANFVIDTQAALQQGTRDTLIESLLMNKKDGWNKRIPKEIITSNENLQKYIKDKSWSSKAQELAKQNIEDGYVLAIVNTKEAYWWKVNPKTGETLGMSEYGGSELTENIVMTITNSLSIISLLASINDCSKTFANNAKMKNCCYAGSIILTVGSAGLSAGASGVKLADVGLGASQMVWFSALGKISSSVMGEMVGYVLGGALVNDACDAIVN